AELLRQRRLDDDAFVALRAQVLDVVAEPELRGEPRANRHERNPPDNRHPRPPNGEVDELPGAERVEVELRRFPRAALADDNQRRQQEDDGEEEQQNADSGEKAELR